MIIFVDESGDTGFKFNKGSSKFFVLGAIFFKDREEAVKFASEFESWLALKNDLNRLDELKFSKLDRIKRLRVLKYLSSRKSNWRAVIAAKLNRDLSPESMLVLAYSTLISTFVVSEKLLLIIDGKENKKVRYRLKKLLKLANRRLEIKLQDSKSDRLLQIADLVAGAAANAASGDKHYTRAMNGLEEVKV